MSACLSVNLALVIAGGIVQIPVFGTFVKELNFCNRVIVDIEILTFFVVGRTSSLTKIKYHQEAERHSAHDFVWYRFSLQLVTDILKFILDCLRVMNGNMSTSIISILQSVLEMPMFCLL